MHTLDGHLKWAIELYFHSKEVSKLVLGVILLCQESNAEVDALSWDVFSDYETWFIFQRKTFLEVPSNWSNVNSKGERSKYHLICPVHPILCFKHTAVSVSTACCGTGHPCCEPGYVAACCHEP